ncbi:MAG: alanine--tRNA ligase [Alphaproteobacteria bacterium]|nr:alanine--tRNA ligase [Alphaproteobacteria bacterium]
MTYDEIRNAFLGYFQSHGHKIVPSASLIPNDPTLLFTVAGMVPWKGILQGLEPAFAPRVADVQKCIRAGGKHNDLDEVGFDGRHHTFFEMLGNWSFGDYFKEESIAMSWELLTRVIGFDPKRIVVTTHETDDESTEIWRRVAGLDAIRLGDHDNWWAAGDTGPCGPDTEIFYDMGADIPGGLPGAPDEGGRYVELWNNVFMQYDRDANGNLTKLPKQNVDTGAGLERWAAILQGKTDNYETDLFQHLMDATESVVGVHRNAENISSFKVITDHLRSVGFAIADGVIPSNTDRGYVIRRILRRAMRHGQMLGARGALLSKLYPALVAEMGAAYPELAREQGRVVEILQNEENAFADMLSNGMKMLDEHRDNAGNSRVLAGDVAFKLYDTYGFPLDLTQMILREYGMTVDVDGFNAAMATQRERSRADTRGTKTLWESRGELPATDDAAKYAPCDNMSATVLAILRDGEFVNVAESGDMVEIAMDKTPFYGTQGGQVGDNGELYRDGVSIMSVTDTSRAGNVVVHRGVLTQKLSVGDTVTPIVNAAMRTQITRAHTATHLLQAALRRVLGPDVEQRGSKVSPDSVRFDFSFGRAMTADEKTAVENLVNEWINADMPVSHEEMPIDAAKSRGAMALFGEKYGDTVRVITAGDVSCELCGGTHVYHTGEIIRAHINKEKSISSGIRRITMSVGTMA